MCSNSPDFRLAIDWDVDGAFAVITRGGEPAEVIRLPDHDRVATEAMAAALALRKRSPAVSDSGLHAGGGQSVDLSEPLRGPSDWATKA